jgi:hypothetical protein
LNAQSIGTTTGAQFTVRIDGAVVIDRPAIEFRDGWRSALEEALQSEPVGSAAD